MKKILLTAACLFLASPAYAVTITNLYAELYNASNTFTGYHTPVSGSLDTVSAGGGIGGGVDVFGDISFYGNIWTADQAWVSTTAGKNTWSGQALTDTYGNQGSFNYTFTLAAGNVAFGLFLDWSIINNIPVLAVMHPNADGSWSPIDQVWYMGTATTPKQGMQTGPFPGQRVLFGAYAPAAVPEPASLLLIGSGLAGLAGLAGRGRRGI